jgi:hypothetical protein
MRKTYSQKTRIADDKLWNLVNGAIWRFRRNYNAAEPHGEILIQRLGGGTAKKTNPTSLCRMAEPKTECAKLNRNVMNKPAQGGFELHV